MAFDNNGDPNRWFYEMTNLGYNYRITDLQASLGNSQLKKLDRFTVKRNKIAKMYNFGLKSNKFIKTPDLRKDVKHAYHLYTILIDFKSINKSRNQLMKELGEVKIGTQVLYIPVFLQPYYRKKYNYKKTDFKNSIKYYEQALSIPIFNSLRKSEIFYVINKLNQIIKK